MCKTIKIFKILALILVLVIIVGLVIYLFPVIKSLATAEGQAAFKDKLDDMGALSIFLVFGIQLAQIFLFVLPGEPIEIFAGMCYGMLGGTIFLVISIMIVSGIILFLVRRYGKKFIYSFFKEEKVEKIENSKVFKNPKKVELAMVILFLIPGTPKDFLVYVAGLLPIKPLRFVIVSTIARLPSILTSTYGGAELMKGNWQMYLIMSAIVFVLAIIIVLIYNHFDKDKTAKEAMKAIK